MCRKADEDVACNLKFDSFAHFLKLNNNLNCCQKGHNIQTGRGVALVGEGEVKGTRGGGGTGASGLQFYRWPKIKI